MMNSLKTLPGNDIGINLWLSMKRCVVSGIIYLAIHEEKQWYQHEIPNANQILDAGGSQYMLLNNTKVSGNSVSSSGPPLFLTDVGNVQLCCGNALTCSDAGAFAESKCHLGDFQSNGSDVLGTFIDSVWAAFEEDIIVHASGRELPPLNVTLLDKLNKTTPIEAKLIMKAFNKSVDLSGPPITGINIVGTVSISNLKLTAVPGRYKLGIEITTEEGILESISKNITVDVRKCLIGEISIANNTLCRECPVNYYSFDTSNPSCYACPKNKAECDGKTVVPLDGYWHSSSQSDLLIRCLNSKACKYSNKTSNRMHALREAAYSNLGIAITWNSNYPLCRKVSLLFCL